MISPVGAHVGNTINHLWNGPGHIKDKSDNRYQAQWAQVAPNGSVIRQSGGITVSHDFTGGYYVRFPTNQNSRAISVTPVWTANVTVQTVQCGDVPGAVPCNAPHNLNERKVYVEINALNTDLVDEGFYITSVP